MKQMKIQKRPDVQTAALCFVLDFYPNFGMFAVAFCMNFCCFYVLCIVLWKKA